MLDLFRASPGLPAYMFKVKLGVYVWPLANSYSAWKFLNEAMLKGWEVLYSIVIDVIRNTPWYTDHQIFGVKNKYKGFLSNRVLQSTQSPSRTPDITITSVCMINIPFAFTIDSILKKDWT